MLLLSRLLRWSGTTAPESAPDHVSQRVTELSTSLLFQDGTLLIDESLLLLKSFPFSNLLLLARKISFFLSLILLNSAQNSDRILIA